MLGISLPHPASNEVPNSIGPRLSVNGYEKLGSSSASRMLYWAPCTAVHVILKNSYGWKREPLPGPVIVGEPDGAGPRPLTVKLCTADHAESIEPTAPPTVCVAFTLQK